MEEIKKNEAPASRNIYVGFLSLTLFLTPITIYVMSRTFALENQTMGFQDYFMFSGYWFAAVLVWARMKFMWLLTICILCLVIFINVLALYRNINSDNSPVYLTQLLLSIAALSGVLIIADYLNSKHFDRRDQFSIFGSAERYAVALEAQIVSPKGEKIVGQITSLSFSGALFEVTPMPSPIYLKQLKLQIPAVPFFKQRPIEIVEIGENKLRLRLTDMNPLFTGQLYNYLKALPKA